MQLNGARFELCTLSWSLGPFQPNKNRAYTIAGLRLDVSALFPFPPINTHWAEEKEKESIIPESRLKSLLHGPSFDPSLNSKRLRRAIPISPDAPRGPRQKRDNKRKKPTTITAAAFRPQALARVFACLFIAHCLDLDKSAGGGGRRETPVNKKDQRGNGCFLIKDTSTYHEHPASLGCGTDGGRTGRRRAV